MLTAPGKFIMAVEVTPDGRDVWVGTEDKGVWRLPARPDDNTAPRGFTTADGLGDDNAYALTIDHAGRVWAGQLNHGVAVFDGKTWKTYGVLEGPYGERVFALATSPVGGDVWMATSAGMARWSPRTDEWSHLTRAEGLPADQASSVAFDAGGNPHVGMQCDGVAIGRAPARPGGPLQWRAVQGPDQPDDAPAGNGLPTSQINALLVARDGAMWAATTSGLARSPDQGATWTHTRGADWADKVRGRWGGAPKGWKPAAPDRPDRLLPEDYVTCLAEDADGLIWMGFRRKGVAAWSPAESRVVFRADRKTGGLPDDFVTCVRPAPDGRVWVGTYGGGLCRSAEPLRPRPVVPAKGKAAPSVAPSPKVKTGSDAPRHPSPAKPLKQAELAALAEPFKVAGPKVRGVYMGEDWTTQGDWVGRYGRQRGMLCAAASPFNHDYGWNGEFRIAGRIGPHCRKDDGLRHWVHWSKTDNPRTMYTPVAGVRRQAEWDDHGEAYPLHHDGPDVWATVKIPAGVYRLSLYFFNKDGHDGMNRLRDYLVELRAHNPDPVAAQSSPVVARTRVRDFWGGVYKTFLVSGPAIHDVRIARNGSYNTICSAVLVDRVKGAPHWTDDGAYPGMYKVHYPKRPPPPAYHSDDPEIIAMRAPDAEPTPLVKAGQDALDALEAAADTTPYAVRQRAIRLQVYRSAGAEATPRRTHRWRWAIPLWTSDDRKEFGDTMRKALQAKKEQDEFAEVLRKDRERLERESKKGE